MSLPDVTVSIRPDSTFAVSGTAVLGTTALGGSFVLGPPAAAFVSLTGQVQRVSITRGRTRVSGSFDTGKAVVTLIDDNGQFDPDNTSSNLYPYMLPLRQFRISADIGGVSYPLFNGYTTRYTYEYEKGSGLTFVTVEAEDAFRLLGASVITNVTGAAAGDPTGTRLEQVLIDLGIPSTLRSISPGDSTVIADPATRRSGLEAAQQCESAELGAYFIDANGTHIFYSRHDVQELAAGVVVTPLVFDESTGLPYVEIKQGFDDEQITNQVTVDGDGITEQTAIDNTSVASYFLRSTIISGSLLNSSVDAAGLASVLVASRAYPEVTVDSITCKPAAMDTADAQAVVEADLLEPITVSKDYAGSTFTRTLTVQGIRHNITPGDWTLEFALAEPVGGDALVLDSTNQGLLDTDLLSY